VERLNRRAVEEEANRCGVPLLPKEVDARCSHLRRGWYWGSQAFAERLTAGLQRTVKRLKSRGSRSALERRSHDQAQAEQWLREGVEATGLELAGFQKLPGSDARKVALARLLWEQTTVGQSWIAQRLGMGSAANVSQQVRRAKAEKKRQKLPKGLRAYLKTVKI
jgi:putative transposase